MAGAKVNVPTPVRPLDLVGSMNKGNQSLHRPGRPSAADYNQAFAHSRQELADAHAEAEKSNPIFMDDPAFGAVPMHPAGRDVILPTPNGSTTLTDAHIGKITPFEFLANWLGMADAKRIAQRLIDRNPYRDGRYGQPGHRPLDIRVHHKGMEHGLNRPIHIIQSPSGQYNSIRAGAYGSSLPEMDFAQWDVRTNGQYTPAHELTHSLLDQRQSTRSLTDSQENWPIDRQNMTASIFHPDIIDSYERHARSKGGYDNVGSAGFKEKVLSPEGEGTFRHLHRYMNNTSEFLVDLAKVKYQGRQSLPPKHPLRDTHTPEQDRALWDLLLGKPKRYKVEEPIIKGDVPMDGMEAEGYNRSQRAIKHIYDNADEPTKQMILDLWHKLGERAKNQGAVYG